MSCINYFAIYSKKSTEREKTVTRYHAKASHTCEGSHWCEVERVKMEKLCKYCNKTIPADAKPNSGYILLGLEYYHRACYLQHIGLEATP